MACIIVGSYLVRYPLGGMLSWALQYLLGLTALGHDLYFVEKAHYPDACFDPSRDISSDDCSFGLTAVTPLLDRFGLAGKWCFVDFNGIYYGLSRRRIEEVFQSADLFVDCGTHGSWLSEAQHCGARVLIDGEPGYTQMRMEEAKGQTMPSPVYDFYYTNGLNFGTAQILAPDAGHQWQPLPNPVTVDLFDVVPPPPNAPFTTVMHWQSHAVLQYRGKVYGQKDIEFTKFMRLPLLTTQPLEAAVGGRFPAEELRSAGWRLCPARQVTATVESYWDYIRRSRGEFSVCKHVFVETRSGWFSDRSAAYLASGRPVVLEETGFSAHLPCGEGLFAVRTKEEAAEAIEEISRNYSLHSKRAREIAEEHLDSRKVMARMLNGIGV
jgi:hypothetical protein